MKILVLLPFSPVPTDFGGALRVFYLLKSLASEHEVTVLVISTPEKTKLFRKIFDGVVKEIHLVPEPWTRNYKRLAQLYSIFSSRSYFNMNSFSKRIQPEIDKLLNENDFDVVHSEFPAMGCYKINTDLIRVNDAHNVEHDNFRKMWLNQRSPLRKWYYYREFKKVTREEVTTLNNQDALLVTSEEDIAILKRCLNNVPAYLVPNGVDTSYFKPSNGVSEPFSIVFTGMMAYTPNDDGILWFLDEIFPIIRKKIPQAKIYIVGKRPTERLQRRQSKHVIVTGYVDDVRPYVWKSSIFVVPLRMGSGTRLKVVEALAMKKPVVSTTLGCEGINVIPEESVLVQDDSVSFADSV
ncbi:MAG: glycosyltransferase family 4 protein, partial [Balneolales bacterium]